MHSIPTTRHAEATGLANGLACVALVIIGTGSYFLVPIHFGQLVATYRIGPITLQGAQWLWLCAATYALVTLIYCMRHPRQQAGKALLCWRVLARFFRAPLACLAAPLAPGEALALRAAVLKAFFGPLMLMSMIDFLSGTWTEGQRIVQAWSHQPLDVLFNQHGFWFLLRLMIFVDVFVYTAGYLVELPSLGNEIRSVESRWIGWAVALACYPPFNVYTHMLLGHVRSDFPQFAVPWVHFLANGLLLGLMGIYTWASLAMGWKASNLTYRGMVVRGPYAWVRHPAYAAKNAAWWIASMPVVISAFARSWVEGAQALGAVLAWTALYAARAITEEAHLNRVDDQYRVYSRRVVHRFIPGLL